MHQGWTNTVITLLLAWLIGGIFCVESAAQALKTSDFAPTLVDDSEVSVIASDSLFLKNSANIKTFEQLKKSPSNRWVKADQDTPFSIEKNWLYSAFQFKNNQSQSWFVSVQSPFVRNIEVYIEVNGILQNHFVTGADLSFNTRPINSRDFVFPVDVEGNSLVEIYAGIQDERFTTIPFIISTQHQYFETEQATQAVLLLLFGAMAMMIFYNIILYFSVGDASYLWYSLSVASMLTVQLAASQFTFQYILPDYPKLNGLLTSVFLWLFHIFSALFCIHALELKRLSIIAFRFFYCLVCMNIILVLLTSATNSKLVNDFGYTLGIVNYLSYFAVGIFAWTRGVSYASYFTIGWSLLCAVRIVVNYQVLFSIYNASITYWVLVGLLWESLFLSIALAVRIRDMQKVEIREKDEFFARISHELRTPINGILGGLELMFPYNHADRKKEVVRCLFQSTYQLYNIVQDVLTFSRYSEQKVELKSDHISLRSFLSELQNDFSLRLKNSGVLYSFSIAKSLPDSVSFDRGCLHTVLTKLLDNSCNYVDNGYIVLYVTEFERQDGKMLVRFSVRDTGTGIHEDELSTIFKEFRQSGSYYTRTHQGLGLGLSTVSECLHRMGSKIKVKSTVGKGSNFYFDIWMDYEEGKPAKTESRRLNNIHLLLVEDNPVNQIIAKKMLESEGATVDIADNGLKGIDKIKESNYDLILMDCAMPVMSGFDAAKEIRHMGHKSLPIVAVTANTMAGDKEKCLAAGMDDYVPKPIDKNSLIVCILETMKKKLQHAG